MAECTQKFKDMLQEYGEDCRSYGYNDGCRPEPSEAAILRYVAALEEYKHTFMVRGYGSRPQDMTGGMP